MVKNFFDVFTTFKIDGDIERLLKKTDVYRVTSSRDKTVLSVYIRSKYIIQKKNIRRLENELAAQLFPEGQVSFRIFESFDLSNQFDAKHLYEEYRESIEFELKDYNPIMERLFHNAGVSFSKAEGSNVFRVLLTVEDTVVSRNLEKDMIKILEKIFCERCGVPTEFSVNYIAAVKSKLAELSEKRFRRESEAIVERAIAAAAQMHGDDSEGDGGFVAGEDVLGAEPGKAPQTGTETAKKTPSFEPKKQSGSFSAPRGRGGKNARYEKRDSFQKSDNPDVVYGREIPEDSELTPIEEIDGEVGEVVIRGKVVFFDEREIKNERVIVTFQITDFSDTIAVKVFLKKDNVKEFKGSVSVGAFIKVKAMAMFDKYDHELNLGSVVGIMKIPSFVVVRKDNNPLKRVELHCHTKMSDMDGVSEVKDIIKRAVSWGHPAIAITDHGVVQAFTDAAHTLKGPTDFKIIYGCEGYIVDDEKKLVQNSRGQLLTDTYVVFDLETTGLSSKKDAIIEIGAVKISGGAIVDRFSEFVNPKRPIPFKIVDLTGIEDYMVRDAATIDVILPKFLDFIGDAALVAHNAAFDVGFIHENAARLSMDREFTVLDTMTMSQILVPEVSRYKLDTVAKALKVSLENHHRAVDDAECAAGIFLKLCDRLMDRGIRDLDTLNQELEYKPDVIMRMNANHIILLAKNEIGRVNLYRLVSEAHLNYFRRFPRIPKSLLSKYREGIIVGSACEAGELFRALLDGQTDEEIARIVSFYDYLEIQPIGNNAFLKREGKAESDEDLKDYNRKIVQLGEQFGKPVVATCDVHFLDPADEVYRRIIMAGKGFDDADDQAPLFLRTTDEMLAEFAYLGAEKAEEVVIRNTNFIADQIDKIPPVRPDKCPPVIENSDQNLRDICNKKAREIYGEELPAPVEERMERELNSIIKNGFAVMYIIAQKLVWKSNEDGYLVGSRGSVGSSFVAFLAGITEVNSLAPHYYCKSCHYNDFDSEEVQQFSGMAGCDMPDKVCPVCGEPLEKDGFDIPFETFLGFKGDKEPDIDLNFSGDYQAKAHKYTEVIFGAGRTFKAGTVGTLADKTAFVYVKKYFEERGVVKRRCEMERIAVGCTGVRRTTGQHPGGIIVLPHGEEIFTFTPVQHPANDMSTDIVTTHFDYHSIDHNLLKLDILGHDDPTMIRFLQDMTGVDPKTIPLDDKGVMSLFQNTDALGITPEDIGGCKLGALGIPEFGTDFAMGMLLDTKPQYFSDLVRIAGLSHGTDVWLGNAEELIKTGQATISTCICTRDDIMIYLIHMGLNPSDSFKIMENVRKGKVAKGGCDQWPAWREDMKAHGVPEWYMKSCEKIQYMFPKAHAAAYVMMAWRIAWCKIYHPLAYYAAFFSIRADEFSYELMCLGREKLERHMADYRSRSDSLAPKEQGQLKVMRLVQEMYARGFEFEPIDITKADAKYFKIVGNKLMPAISSIDGVGDNAADAIVEAAKGGEFLSRDDFRERAGVSKTIAELLDNLGLLGDIPESNQISLFDLL